MSLPWRAMRWAGGPGLWGRPLEKPRPALCSAHTLVEGRRGALIALNLLLTKPRGGTCPVSRVGTTRPKEVEACGPTPGPCAVPSLRALPSPRVSWPPRGAGRRSAPGGDSTEPGPRRRGGEGWLGGRAGAVLPQPGPAPGLPLSGRRSMAAHVVCPQGHGAWSPVNGSSFCQRCVRPRGRQEPQGAAPAGEVGSVTPSLRKQGTCRVSQPGQAPSTSTTPRTGRPGPPETHAPLTQLLRCCWGARCGQSGTPAPAVPGPPRQEAGGGALPSSPQGRGSGEVWAVLPWEGAALGGVRVLSADPAASGAGGLDPVSGRGGSKRWSFVRLLAPPTNTCPQQ